MAERTVRKRQEIADGVRVSAFKKALAGRWLRTGEGTMAERTVRNRREIAEGVRVSAFKKALAGRFDLRGHMGFMLAGVATAAILANKLLLLLGMQSMPLRYGFAATLSYGVFFLLLRIWLVYVLGGPRESTPSSDDGDRIDVRGSRFLEDWRMPTWQSSVRGGGGRSGGGGASASFGEGTAELASEGRSGGGSSGGGSRSREDRGKSSGGSGGPLGLLGALLVFILPLIVIGTVCYYLVSTGPDLLGEIAFQAVLAGALLGRASGVGTDSWLHAAFRRTRIPFAIVLAVVLVAGAYAQYRCPRARTLAEVLWLCGF